MSMLPVAAMAVISGTAAVTNPIPQDSPKYAENHLRIVYENDAISGMDRDYTHGTRLEYLHGWERHSLEMGVGASLTQNMYTPVHKTSGAVPGEHPYAGYMALGAIGYVRSEDFSMTLELQLGTTGEPSLAHGTQHLVHELGRIDQWKGWDSQVPAEATFQIAQQVARQIKSFSGKIGSWDAETFVFGRYDMGTVRRAVGAGAGFRIGHNLSPVSAQILGNRAANIGLATAIEDLLNDNDSGKEFSYYLVGNVYGEYVARDFSVDGGMFHHFDRTCGRQPWQAEARLGVGVTYQGIDYFMGVTAQSRTYRTQDRNSVYGTFSISWHW